MRSARQRPTTSGMHGGQLETCAVSLEELEGYWMHMADKFAPHNAGSAQAYRDCAADLAAARRMLEAEVLTLAQAAEESGYSKDHLERQIREGRIPNAGRFHAPRIRRTDLPRRAGVLPRSPQLRQVEVSRRQIARAVVSSKTGDHDG